MRDSLGEIGDGGETGQPENECTPDALLLDDDGRDLVLLVLVVVLVVVVILLLRRRPVPLLHLLLVRDRGGGSSFRGRILVVVDGPPLGLDATHDGDKAASEPSEQEQADEDAGEGESQIC